MKVKGLIVSLAAMLPALALAAPAADKTPAFTPEEYAARIASMPEPSKMGGFAVHSKQFCASCHGQKGISMTERWPHVAGQPFDVTVKSLLDYRDGRRTDGAQARLMTSVAKRMSDQDIVDVAHLYEMLPGPDGTALKVEATTVEGTPANIMTLVTKGDPVRAITPCAACHGASGNGRETGQVPVLHGQNPTYLAGQLKDYRSGKRSADMLKEMRFFAQQLNDEEIAGLAAYYAGLPGWPGTMKK